MGHGDGSFAHHVDYPLPRHASYAALGDLDRDGWLDVVASTGGAAVLAFDADGSAVILHAGPDNFANIPVRYAPNGPDATTLATGDSGARTACGTVEHDN